MCCGLGREEIWYVQPAIFNVLHGIVDEENESFKIIITIIEMRIDIKFFDKKIIKNLRFEDDDVEDGI